MDKIGECSVLSADDYISIVGNFNFLISKNKEDVSREVKNRGYSKEALEAAELALKKKFVPVTSLNLKFNKPLSQFKYPLMNFLLTAHDHYQRGTMPFSGGFADQPNQIIEAMGLLDNLKSEYDEKIKKANSGGRKHKN